MSSFPQKNESDYVAVAVKVDDDFLTVVLSDGREIRVPLEFYPRLRNASEHQRSKFELIGLGTGIHWPDIDEDLSVTGIVLGIPSR